MVTTPLLVSPQLTGLVATEAAAILTGGFKTSGAEIASQPVFVTLLSVIRKT